MTECYILINTIYGVLINSHRDVYFIYKIGEMLRYILNIRRLELRYNL